MAYAITVQAATDTADALTTRHHETYYVVSFVVNAAPRRRTRCVLTAAEIAGLGRPVRVEVAGRCFHYAAHLAAAAG